MIVSLSVLQVLGLVLAGMVGGAALLMLLISWIATASSGDSGADAGCAVLGSALLVTAGYIAVRVLIAN